MRRGVSASAPLERAAGREEPASSCAGEVEVGPEECVSLYSHLRCKAFQRQRDSLSLCFSPPPGGSATLGAHLDVNVAPSPILAHTVPCLLGDGVQRQPCGPGGGSGWRSRKTSTQHVPARARGWPESSAAACWLPALQQGRPSHLTFVSQSVLHKNILQVGSGGWRPDADLRQQMKPTFSLVLGQGGRGALPPQPGAAGTWPRRPVCCHRCSSV